MQRHSFLTALGVSPALIWSFQGLALASTLRLIVSDLSVYRVQVNHRGNWLTGVGDTSQSGDAESLKYLKLFSDLLRGQEATRINWFRRSAVAHVVQGAAGAAAMSGLEQALWDILGNALSVPVSDQLGGRMRREIRSYANINRSTLERTPGGFARMAGRPVQDGFDAVKLAPFDQMLLGVHDYTVAKGFLKTGLACAQAVRQAIGSRCDLLLDARSRFDVQQGLELATRAEAFKLFWLEEVTNADPLENLMTLNRNASMPTAGVGARRGDSASRFRGSVGSCVTLTGTSAR